MPEPGRDTVALAVVESSQAGEARRLASDLARWIGFDPMNQGKIALIVTELGHNLVRHASQGEMLIQRVQSRERIGLEIMAIDRGPGMADLSRCFADGYSTGGTPGTGLGAVARQADRFDVHSIPLNGTVIAARVWLAERPGGERSRSRPSLDIGAVCLPMAGEVACGDAWAADDSTPGRTTLIVADGLGHGPQAAEAANQAVARFRQSPGLGPGEHLEAIHPALRATRGAAVAIAAIDHERREVRFAGAGNIAGTIIDEDNQRRGLVSHNGTVGATMRKVQEFTLPWPSGALLVLHSDGLTSQWRLDDQTGLRARTPEVIAATLYRDYSRGRDDVTVVVARDGSSPPP